MSCSSLPSISPSIRWKYCANKEIAQRLFLTESTVELHASRIRKKLKLKSRTALVKYACDNGLV
ncbi:MAG: response regulator transcription factor [Candidatus Obscuribacter sp.]|nr:response regulator transcription factor [Candidatus Obscuribacter sp.]MBP6350845.1 response regulator transcription factor [Candidatus Obscuribacter sp.]MBP6592001.1 response regulator transcription factor [Candidatus Obscuribacter sp.]MBP7575395.1 response regulator transcription factor [Candidatus Obscuribacter sp.]